MTTTDFPVVLFDGVCNLCNSSVQFVIRRDPDAVIRFASLQSDYARARLANAGLNPDHLYSIVVFSRGKLLEKSDAALEIARYLKAPWKWLAIFRFVPRFVRNAVYDFVAANRYRWFGRSESCMIPTPELKGRFLS